MSIKRFESFEVNEKWAHYVDGKKKEVEGGEAKPKPKKEEKDEFEGKNVMNLKAERRKLKDKEERSEDDTKRLRQLAIAIKKKTGTKKIEEDVHSNGLEDEKLNIQQLALMKELQNVIERHMTELDHKEAYDVLLDLAEQMKTEF